jgi:putative ABC transport system substrate-binding protein
MRRRAFIAGLGSTVAWPLAARAQQSRIPTIGVLYSTSASEWADRITAFGRGLGETGFVEGRTVSIEYRWANNQTDRMAGMLAELVDRKVAVLLVGGNVMLTRAAISATRTIPIVFTTASDPVQQGYVASLSRPGGNVTGVTVFGAELTGKRLELLHELVPTATKIALLVNPNNSGVMDDAVKRSEAAASKLGIGLIIIKAPTDSEIMTGFADAVDQRVDAISIANDSYLTTRSKLIAFLALRYRLPTLTNAIDSISTGLLMAYGPDQLDQYQQAGIYVGRILKGEKPADLPVLQPTKFKLVINLTVAKVLGLAISESFLLRADEVIE